MSGIVGPVTPGRIAFALGTIGVGALVGGAIADHRDSDVGRGALYGGLAAAAGLSLLYGGAYAWNRVSAARSGASAGASQLGAQLTRFTAPARVAPAAPIATTAAARMQLPPAASLFHTPASIPAIARTPVLPPPSLPASGGTFLDALRGFLA